MLIEHAQPHDLDRVFSDWKLSYRLAPGFVMQCDCGRKQQWPFEGYMAHQQRTIEQLLPRSTVLVARPEGWPEGIMGWACAEQQADAFVVHYGYVKRRYRAKVSGEPSVFWELLRAMQPWQGALHFTHMRPPYTNTLVKNGFTHAPDRAGKATP